MIMMDYETGKIKGIKEARKARKWMNSGNGANGTVSFSNFFKFFFFQTEFHSSGGLFLMRIDGILLSFV